MTARVSRGVDYVVHEPALCGVVGMHELLAVLGDESRPQLIRVGVPPRSACGG